MVRYLLKILMTLIFAQPLAHADSFEVHPELVFSQKDMERIATHEIKDTDDFYRMAGVTAAVAPQPPKPDPFGKTLAVPLIPRDSADVAPLRKIYLDQQAQQAADKFDGYSLKGGKFEHGMNLIIAGGRAVTTFSKGKDRGYGAATAELGSAVKDVVIDFAQRDAVTPNLGRRSGEILIRYALEQVRLQTSEGKVLEPYVQKYLHMTPEQIKDLKNSGAVKDEYRLYLTLKNAKSIDEVFETLRKTNEKMDKLGTTVEHITGEQEDAKKAAQDLVDELPPPRSEAMKTAIRDLDDASNVFAGYGQLFDMMGRTDFSDLFDKLSRLTGTLSEVLNKQDSMTAAWSFNMWTTAANLAVSLFIKKKQSQESPFKSLANMLTAISKQIDNMERTIVTRLDQMNAGLTGLMTQNLTLSRAIQQTGQEALLSLAEIQKKLDDMKRIVTNNAWETADILLSSEDDTCLNYSYQHVASPLSLPSFQSCRNKYLRRATELAKGQLAQSAVAKGKRELGRETLKAFPMSDYYNQLHTLYPQGTSAQNIVNPSTWMAGTVNYLELLKNNQGFLNNADAEGQLDRAIQAGKEARDFAASVAVEEREDNYVLRKDRFENLLNQIAMLRKDAVHLILSELENGNDVRIYKGNAQDVDGNVAGAYANKMSFCFGTPAYHVSQVVQVIGDGRGSNWRPWRFSDLDERDRNRIVEEMEADLKTNMPANKLSFDEFWQTKIAKPLRLLAKMDKEHYGISACLAHLSITKLNQINPQMTYMGVAVGIVVRMPIGPNNHPVDVEVLEGEQEFDVKTSVIVSYSTPGSLNASGQLLEAMNVLQGHWNFVQHVPLTEIDKRGEALADAADKILEIKQKETAKRLGGNRAAEPDIHDTLDEFTDQWITCFVRATDS